MNDVRSVKQDGVVLSINRCELVYRRRSRSRLRRRCYFTVILGDYQSSQSDKCAVGIAGRAGITLDPPVIAGEASF